MSTRLCILLSLLAVWPVCGQQSVDLSNPSQTSPPDNILQSREPVMPESLKPRPSPFSSGRSSTFDILPGSPPPAPISPQQAMQWQKLLDDRKNWTLLTPEEILGVPTAEKILGVPSANDGNNLTATERYMKRMDADSQLVISATNALQQDAWLNGDSAQNGTDSLKSGGSRSGLFSSQLWGQTPGAPDKTVPVEKPVSIWNSAFTQPPVAPKSDPEQLASMERFRVLLGSVEPPKPVVTELPNQQPLAPVVDPYMQVLPEANPAGNSYTVLKNTTSKPMGIMPLPGLTARPVQIKTADPADPQLPPWLSHQPPPPGMQQRVY